jgi:hypothetical protein
MSMSPNTSPSFDTPGNSFPDLDTSLPSFNAPFDPSHLLSPQMHNAPFHFSIPELGDGQSPSSAHFNHRMSIGSSGPLPNQLHPGSIADSDATSPVSGQDPGSVGPPTNASTGQPGLDDQKAPTTLHQHGQNSRPRQARSESDFLWPVLPVDARRFVAQARSLLASIVCALAFLVYTKSPPGRLPPGPTTWQCWTSG